MKNMKLFLLTISTLLLVNTSNSLLAKDVFIDNDEALKEAIKNAEAGDNLILQNGTYEDINIVFYGQGTKEKPITLKAQTPGKVFIEGASDLKIGGSYLHVEGLYFRNGYSPSRSVITFGIDWDRIAFNSKVTDIVIEEFTQPDREVKDVWVQFFGQHNELSNSYIAGKSNGGPTVMVQLKGNQHINNYHQIINNHFGPRPRKGGPSAETMQIGDSSTSMTPSYTNVENNFFDRCNGEVEIISSKSNFNRFKNNVFYKSEGSLVLRHGNYATVDGNVFIGDGESEFFGGIRVINTGHWITNNYFYKLKGDMFRAPLAVMNGIPKSPLNRYNQVTDAVVAYNSWVESPTPWHFSVGSNVDQSDVLPASEIRSARPIRTIFANNLIYNSSKAEYPIRNYDKVDGIVFKNNVSNNNNKAEVQTDGITQQAVTMANLSEYLMIPTFTTSDLYQGFDFDKIHTDLFGVQRSDNNNVGAVAGPVGDDVSLIDEASYGTSWFKAEKEQGEANVVKVASSEELFTALEGARSGDTILLTKPAYTIDKTININKKVLFASEDKVNKSTINFTTDNTAFLMQPKGDLQLSDIVLKGNGKQNAFSTLDKNMSKAYNLLIKNTEVHNFKNILDVSRGSFSDSITVENSIFKNHENGFLLNKETRNKGDYNVEFLTIKGSVFDNIDGSILDYHRGGYDESTIGGSLVFENNTVTKSGEKQEDGILIKNRGIVNVSVANNNFKNNSVKLIAIHWGAKGQKPLNNSISNSGEFKVVQNLELELVY